MKIIDTRAYPDYQPARLDVHKLVDPVAPLLVRTMLRICSYILFSSSFLSAQTAASSAFQYQLPW